MGNYKLAILPELHDVSETLSRALWAFVENGGKLLVIQADEDSINPALASLAGVDAAGRAPLDYTYVEYARDGKINSPFIVRGVHNLVTPQDGVKVLAHIIEPLQGGGVFGHGFAPPAKTTGCAAATLRQVGEGRVIYLAARILSSNIDYCSPDFGQFLLGLVEILLPEPIARLVADAPVEMSLMRRDGDLFIHLVNHGGVEVKANGWCPITKYMPKITGIHLTVQPGAIDPCRHGISVFSTNPAQTDAGSGYRACITEDKKIEISGITLDVMESIRIGYYFGGGCID